MQWDASANAGFNRGAAPWLPVAADYRTRNAAAEARDPGSVLALYRTLIAGRRANPALAGDFVSVNRDDPSVLSYLRVGRGRAVLVLLNFAGHPAEVTLAAAGTARVKSVIASNRARADATSVRLDALGVFVAEVETAR